MAGLNSIITGIAIAGGLIAFTRIGGGILDRVDDALDENTDGDSRTAAFAEARVAGDRESRGGEAMPKQSPAGYEIAPHRTVK